MGIISVTTITSNTETITRVKLNGLAANLLTEFNGNIDNDNIKAGANIAYSKLNLSSSIVIADLSATGTPSSSTYLRGDNTWATPPGSGSSVTSTTFTNANLTAGVYTFNHALSAQYPNISVYDNNDKQITPDEVTATDSNNAAIDLSSFGTLTGTWKIVGVA